MKKTWMLAAAMPLILAFWLVGYASAETPDSAADLQRQMQGARKDAEAAGAMDHFPELFAQAVESYQAAQGLLADGDVEAALAEGREALLLLEILGNLANALNLKETILEYGFDDEEPEAFADAEAKYADALAGFAAGKSGADELSRQPLDAYQSVLSSGFARIAEEERARAIEAKALCDSIKAERSMQAEYHAADGLFADAAQSGVRGAWEAACKGYRDAAAIFAEAYQNALYKKEAAEDAMRTARARQEASRELGIEADKTAPLPDEDGAQPQLPSPRGSSGESRSIQQEEDSQ